MEENAIIHELRKRQTNIDPASPGFRHDIDMVLKIADSNYQIGDVFKGLAELRSNGLVNFIECDPPYGIELNKVKASKDTTGNNVESYHEVPIDQYQTFLDNLTKELFRVASNHCFMVFWYGPTWHTQVLKSLRDAGWLVDDIPAIWVKGLGQTLQPELYLARTYEPFFVCRKGNPVLMKRGRANVFQFQGVAGQKKYHPTERPVELIEELITVFAQPSGYILVPFLGSGATLRASYNQGHKASGWDLNAEYKDKFMLKVEEDSRKMLANDNSDDVATDDDFDPDEELE